MDGKIKEQVNSSENLGIMFDNKLKFQCQIDLVNSKLSRINGITYELSRCLNLSTARTFRVLCRA